MPDPAPRRLGRLAEELEEAGLVEDVDDEWRALLLEEVDRALRPPVHEGRVLSSGTMLDPRSDPATWEAGTQLTMTRGALGQPPLTTARLFADGLSSWILRRADGNDEWLLFDRPAGSERDLVVLASVFQATLVQRHPTGSVRLVGPFGVLRWQGFRWHHEAPASTWVHVVAAGVSGVEAAVLEDMLTFAVHDLGSMHIGAILIYRPDRDPGPPVEERLPTPPPLLIRDATQLAPLRHALAQIDGAAMFDAEGVLRRLGVRLVPSEAAEQNVAAVKGTRHTSARRYSRDDPRATVIAVSDDGPVSVFRDGEVLAHSHPE